jgi:hypothetical protein
LPFASAAAAAAAARRGLGCVSAAHATPGVGAYAVNLGAALDAVLAANRQARQFPANASKAAGTAGAAGDTAGAAAASSAAVAFSGAAVHDSLRSAPLAVQQGRAAPAFSFATSGRADASKVFPGGELFLPLCARSPDTPGHFYQPFPAPPFNTRGAAASPGAFTLGGGGVPRGSHVTQACTDSFPDARLGILDAVAGLQPNASPFASVAVHAVPKASRTAAAVGGLRTTWHAVRGDSSGGAARLDTEAVYADYRGGWQHAATAGANQRAAAATQRAADVAAGLRGASPPLPRFASARVRYGGPTPREGSPPNCAPVPSAPSAPSAGYLGAEVPDRLWARESPGPAAHHPAAAFEALQLGGHPERQRGVKLALAKRFAPQVRLDGTVVDHPLEQMHALALASRREQQRHRDQPPRAATTTANAAKVGSATFQARQQQTARATRG